MAKKSKKTAKKATGKKEENSTETTTVVKPTHTKTIEGFGVDLLDKKKLEGTHR